MQSADAAVRVIVALDYAERRALFNLVDQLDPELCKLKIGKETFTRFGPALVKRLVKRGYAVFLDLKFHDIPNTVAQACRAATDLGVWMINVHAQGGPAMLAAARAAVPVGVPWLIGVTVLTSLDAGELAASGIMSSPADYAARLAKLVQNNGLDGVVCSAHEAPLLRRLYGPGFKLITPGIRPVAAASDDQKRVMTAKEACLAGADYLVIGRPITQSNNPVGQLLTINSEIAGIA